MIRGVTPWTLTTEEKILREDTPATINTARSLWFMLFLSNFDKLSRSFTVLKQSTFVSVSLPLYLCLLFVIFHQTLAKDIFFSKNFNSASVLFMCTAKDWRPWSSKFKSSFLKSIKLGNIWYRNMNVQIPMW